MVTASTTPEALSLLQDLEQLSDADPRDLGSTQLSLLRRLFERPDEGIGLFLFARVIFGYRDLTRDVHLPICRLLSRWGESVFEDGYVDAAPVAQTLIETHGEVVESYRRLMVTIPREHFKCPSVNARVHTTEGWVEAGKLKAGDYVYTYGGLKRQVLNTRRRKASGVRVSLSSGLQIEVTNNHPFYQLTGWKFASALRPGDAIATAESTPDIDVPYAPHPYLAGCLVGDGCLRFSPHGKPTTPTLECHEQDILDALTGYEVFLRPRSTGTTYSVPQEYWKHLPKSMWSLSIEKRIPNEYQRSPLFLRGLFDTDGSVGKKLVNLSTSSEGLARDVCLALRYHGISAKLFSFVSSNQYGFKGKGFHVNISGYRNLKRFKHRIGFAVSRKMCKLEDEIQKTPKSGTSYREIPPEWRGLLRYGDEFRLRKAGIRVDNKYWTGRDKVRRAGKALGRSDLIELAESPLCWDRVVSVEPVDEMWIAELSTSDDHTYIAEGILNHNTSVCTRAAPVWHLARDPLHNLTFGIFNEKAENVQAWIFSITQTLERSRLFQLLWPEMLPRGVSLADQERGVTRRRDIKWGAGGVLFERDGVFPELSIEGHGIGGAVTGKHYTHKILDDIIGKEAAYSPAVMQHAVNWVDNSRPLERPAENGCELVANTPWAFNDVYSHMLTKWPGEYRVYRRHVLENDEGEFDIHDGRPIMPEKFTLRKARSLFDKEHYFVNMAQYACLPLPSKDIAFDIQWIRYGSVVERGSAPIFRLKPDHYDPTVFDMECGDTNAPAAVPLSWLNKAILLDPAPSKPAEIKRDPRAGNGIAVVGKDPWGRRYLLECRSEKESPNRILEVLYELSLKWETDLIGIEEVNFSAVYGPLYIEIAQYRWPDWRPQLFPLRPKGREKYSRIRQALIAPMESGMWIFNTHGTAKVTREMIEFGITGSEVDVLDATSYTDEVLDRPQTPTETSRAFYRRMADQQGRGLTGYGRFLAEESPR